MAASSSLVAARTLRALGLAVLVLLASPGCVRTEEARKPAAQVNLVIVRGQGGVKLSWASVRGQVYTLQMKDRAKPGAKWEFHPQAINLMGTGQQMEMTDTPPPGINRQYRLHLFGVKGSAVGAGK